MGLMLALDTNDVEYAKKIVSEAREYISYIKISHVLLASSSKDDLNAILDDTPVFLDLKWFDIPNTVELAIKSYNTHIPNLQYFTFHGVAGDSLINIVSKYKNQALSVISLSSEKANKSYFLEQARRNYNLGIRGFICPGIFLEPMRAEFGDYVTLVTPGIRNESSKNDHVFATALEDAKKWGATHWVVGRPILESTDIKQATIAYQ